MKQEKEYYAFISYKREDEKWAKWLQNKLEHYRFPTNLNGRTDLPKNIRPTFRDVTDLNPGLLAEEINNALYNSEWLIVVCSPRSAKSQWVCKEAQTFIDLGLSDHIVPFVIEGKPFSGDISTECYPEALLKLTDNNELLAANINEMGRDAAAIKVIARMFNLRFDVLWQRYEREQRRRRWMWIVVAMIIALFGMCIGGYFVQQNRTISKQKSQLENAANRLRADSLTLANHVLRIQNDSLQLVRKNDRIQKQKDSLLLTNKLLADERNNVLIANWNMMENQGRAVAEKAKELIANGNVMTGAALAYFVLPQKGNALRPYVPEAEQALRAAYDSLMFGTCSYALLENHGQVLSIAFSNDDKYLLTTSNDETVKVWDVQTGREITSCLLKHNQSVLNAVFGPGQHEVMTFLYDGEVNLWNLKSKKKTILQSIRGKYPILSQDGKTIAINTNENNRALYQLWNTQNWSLITSLYTTELDYLPQKDLIAYAKGDSAVLCNYNNMILDQWKVSNSRVLYDLTLFPDGKNLLTCTNDTLSIWDISSKKQIFTYSENEGFWGANISTDGHYIVSRSEFGKINIFDVRSSGKQPIHTICCNASVIEAMFSPKLTVLGECNFKEGIVRLYKNPILQKSKQQFQLLYKTNNDIYYSTSENHVISIDNDSICLNDILKGTKSYYYHPFTKEIVSKSGNKYSLNMINNICYSPQLGYWALLPKKDRNIHILTNDLKEEIAVIPINAQVFTMAFSKDSKFLGIGCRDKNIYIWDMQTNKLYAKLEGHQKGVTSISFSDDNRFAITSSFDHTIRIWDLMDKVEIFEKRMASEYEIHSVALCSNSKYCLYADERFIYVKDLHTKKVLYTLNIDDAQSVRFSSDGKFIVAQRGDINHYDYNGNSIIRIPFPSYEEIYSFFSSIFSDYKLSEEEQEMYYLK